MQPSSRPGIAAVVVVVAAAAASSSSSSSSAAAGVVVVVLLLLLLVLSKTLSGRASPSGRGRRISMAEHHFFQRFSQESASPSLRFLRHGRDAFAFVPLNGIDLRKIFCFKAALVAERETNGLVAKAL